MRLRHPKLARALAENIRQVAARRGIALNALADLSGLSRAHFYDVLAGRKSITVDRLAGVADALGVEASALLRHVTPR